MLNNIGYTSFLLYLILSITGFSQSPDGGVGYTIVSNSPFKHYEKVYLTPLSGVVAPYCGAIQLETGGEIKIGRLNLLANFNKNYIDKMVSGINTTYGYSINKRKKGKSFSARIGFVFAKVNKKNCYYKVPLFGTGTVNYYIKVKATKFKEFLIEGGIDNGFTYYDFGNTTLKGIDVTTNSPFYFNTQPYNSDFQNVSSYFEYSNIAFGIKKLTTKSLIIDTEDYGKRKLHEHSFIYFNFLMNRFYNFNDIYLVGKKTVYSSYASPTPVTTFEQVNLNSTRIAKTGFKFGMEYSYLLHHFYGSFGIEAGRIPGPAYSSIDNTHNLFIGWKIRFTFTNIKY